MLRLKTAVLALTLLPGILHAQAEASTPLLAAQIALERAGFSPGLLDGTPGPKTVLATREFQKARGLPQTGNLDSATLLALNAVGLEAMTTYTIQAADASLVSGPLGTWTAKSRMRFLGYASLADAIAERFHCSQKFLARVNPGLNIDRLKVGDTLNVPAIQPPAGRPRAHRLEINLTQKTIRAYDSGGQLVGLFHCSIARNAEKRPTKSASVVVIANDPEYRFDPAMWPEVKDVKQVLIIPSGPRNPVGLCWIGLSLPGYGIHGTPNPDMIGKTGSHGCFRLANWDAVRLGAMLTVGTPVTFVY